MTRFEVTEAKIWHCGAIIRRLRDEHKDAIGWLGLNSHREIRDRFDASVSFRRSFYVDGHLSGLGGVTGPAIASDGMIWLALTEQACWHPYAVAREAKRQLAEIMQVKRTLTTTLIPTDKTALRFALKLGFEVDEPIPIPVGSGHVVTVRFGRKLAA